MGIEFTSVPIGSLMLIKEGRDSFIESALATPPNIQSMAFSPRTGAYIRGLAKTYNLAEDAVGKTAFLVLEVITGHLSLSKLGAAVSSNLRLPNDKAQRISQEIERDLFAPVILELNQYLSQRKIQTLSRVEKKAQQAGARNVLNLKTQSNPPRPPAIPY